LNIKIEDFDPALKPCRKAECGRGTMGNASISGEQGNNSLSLIRTHPQGNDEYHHYIQKKSVPCRKSACDKGKDRQ
jgi:hypothetical protein